MPAGRRGIYLSRDWKPGFPSKNPDFLLIHSLVLVDIKEHVGFSLGFLLKQEQSGQKGANSSMSCLWLQLSQAWC